MKHFYEENLMHLSSNAVITSHRIWHLNIIILWLFISSSFFLHWHFTEIENIYRFNLHTFVHSHHRKRESLFREEGFWLDSLEYCHDKVKGTEKFRVPYLHIMMTTTTKNNQSEWLAFEWKIVFTSKGLFHFYRSKRYILLNHESNVINLRHCIGMLRSSRVLCFSHKLGQSV